MIQKLQKLFHTDKWWGRMFFITFSYVIFWCIFYGSLLLIPENSFVGYEWASVLILFYVFIFVPFLLFNFFSAIAKVTLNKNAKILNFSLVIISLALFLILDFIKSSQSWFSF